ncbi:hypothetical protein F4678DRAFT_464492 [Xylaria arbuscula]|nr:hypothetical protein F4678DRAFT_464492 [Xylaria arbuscula]
MPFSCFRRRRNNNRVTPLYQPDPPETYYRHPTLLDIWSEDQPPPNRPDALPRGVYQYSQDQSPHRVYDSRLSYETYQPRQQSGLRVEIPRDEEAHAPLVDSNGVMYSISPSDQGLLREVISSGIGWTTTWREGDQSSTYETLGGADTSSRPSHNGPMSPIEHDCGCTGDEADGSCGQGRRCCKYRSGQCCQPNSAIISPVDGPGTGNREQPRSVWERRAAEISGRERRDTRERAPLPPWLREP